MIMRNDTINHSVLFEVLPFGHFGIINVWHYLSFLHRHRPDLFSVFIRAVTIHQTHNSVCITIFDPWFDTNLDFLE